MIYLALKHLHVTCVLASGAGFLLRGLLMLAGRPLRKRWLRILPHVIDTLLLGSAIALAVISHQYPFVQPWLTAKVIALVAYIGCGTMALKRGKSRAARAAFFVAALLIYVDIVAVALTRNPLGLFALIAAA
jgi:uncharacterized membrane protein SirB2